LSGEQEKATKINNWLIDAMTRDAESGNKDGSIGHYADRELAYVYLRKGNYDKALQHAIAEYNRRPENIDANETVAWVYLNKGNYDKARTYIDAAMKTNSQNPVLLAHAGLIYTMSGDKAKGKLLLEKMVSSKANIPEQLRAQLTDVFNKF
jgi:Flp pilus assembly protein TadD